MGSGGKSISLDGGGQLIVIPNPSRPQVSVGALSRDMRSVVTLVLTLEERDRLVAALQTETGGA